MSTVYTVNGKVLKNSATDKWLTKKETPVFVMNSSNAINLTEYAAFWEAPTFPASCDFDGKSIEVTIKDTGVSFGEFRLSYASSSTGAGGPYAIQWTNPDGSGPEGHYEVSTGTYQMTGLANLAGGDYGKYLALSFSGPPTWTKMDAETLAKIEIKVYI